MALIIPVGFAQALVPFKHAGLVREAVITFGIDTSGLGGDYVAGADAQVWYLNENWGAWIDSDVTIGPTTLRVGQDGGDPLTVEGSLQATGTNVSGMLPPNCALLIKKQTNLGGRRGRGRCYFPWVADEGSVNESGAVNTGSVATYTGAANDWLTMMAAGDSIYDPTPMVLLHDSSGAGVEPAPTPVVSMVCDALIATQRRRLGR
jgi:hypothetical protein